MNRVGWTAPELRDPGLEPVVADFFIEAGAIVAEQAVRGRAGRSDVEAVLRRAALQAARLLAGGADLEGTRTPRRR